MHVHNLHHSLSNATQCKENHTASTEGRNEDIITASLLSYRYHQEGAVSINIQLDNSLY